jgi:hypothetical protein
MRAAGPISIPPSRYVEQAKIANAGVRLTQPIRPVPVPEDAEEDAERGA